MASFSFFSELPFTAYESRPGFSTETSGAWFARIPASPDAVGTVTISVSTSTTRLSGVTTSSFNIRSLCRGCHFLRLLAGLFDRADHVERLFGHVVALAFEDLFETLDRVLNLYVLALEASELFTHRKRLREETLD